MAAAVLFVVFASPTPVGAEDITSVTVVASGDLATTGTLDTKVSDSALTRAPDMMITLGDNLNLGRAVLCDESPCSALDEYTELFAPTWGRLPNIHPAPGNHDYLSNYGTDYMAYFGVPAYYSFDDIPGWHIISLNSMLGSADYRLEKAWLTADLAAVPTTTSILAYWHQPLFSTACHHPGQWTKAKALWDILLAHGAKTLVANGHTHVYERYAPMDPAGQPASDGITELAIGTGGAPRASCFVTGTPAPAVGDLGAHVGLLTLSSDGTYHVDVHRVPASGSATLIDQFDG